MKPNPRSPTRRRIVPWVKSSRIRSALDDRGPNDRAFVIAIEGDVSLFSADGGERRSHPLELRTQVAVDLARRYQISTRLGELRLERAHATVHRSVVMSQRAEHRAIFHG